MTKPQVFASRNAVLPFSSEQAFPELLLISRLGRSSPGFPRGASLRHARVRSASEVPAPCRKAACLLRFAPATPLKQGPSAVCLLSTAPRVRVAVPRASATLCSCRRSVVRPWEPLWVSSCFAFSFAMASGEAVACHCCLSNGSTETYLQNVLSALEEHCSLLGFGFSEMGVT